MALNLSVIKSPSGVTLAVAQKTFAEQGGTIGRGDGNDWVLEDPERFLSSKHCLLSFEGGQYYLTDTSTNGTFINGAPEPLGKGGKIPINDGDTVEIGDYQFRAELQSGVGGVDAFGAGAPGLDMGGGASDPFASSAPPSPSPSAFDSADPFASDPLASDPFASPQGFPGGQQADDPFGGAPFGGGAGSAPQPFGADSGSGGGFDDSSMFGDVSLTPDSTNVDPLDALDKVAGGPAFGGGSIASSGNASSGNASSGGFDQGGFSLEDDSQDPIPSNDFLAPNHPPGHDAFGAKNTGTHSDGAGALNQSVEWPEAKNEGLIPEGWDDNLLGGAALGAVEAVGEKPKEDPFSKASSDPLTALDNAPLESPPHSPGGESSSHVSPGGAFPGTAGLKVGDEHKSLPLTDPPKRRPVQPVANAQESLLDERKPERAPSFPNSDTGKNSSGNVSNGDSAGFQVEQNKSANNASSSALRQKVAQAAGDALLDGMGLSNKSLANEDVEQVYASIGELIPVVVDGMMQVLRSRASIKNEFRMNVTTIQPVENNPLKFSADASEAIDNMFVRKSSAYMGAKEAFQEGFDGVGEHQVAIIAGIRAGFESMMERFNPELLEKQFDRQGKGVNLPGMQKARYWNNYVDHYKAFVDNMENTFQYLFGDEFVQAYEEQLRRLAVERKKKQKT